MASEWSAYRLGVDLDRASHHRIMDRELPFSPIPAIDITYPMDWIPSHDFCPFCSENIACSWYHTSCFHELSGSFLSLDQLASNGLTESPLPQCITRIQALADFLEVEFPDHLRCCCISEEDSSEAFLDYTAYRKDVQGYPEQATAETLELVNVRYSFSPRNNWHVHGQVYKYSSAALEDRRKRADSHLVLPCGFPQVCFN